MINSWQNFVTHTIIYTILPANPEYVGLPPKFIVDIWGQVILCGLALLKSVNQMIIDNINVMDIDNLSLSV